MRSEGLLGVRVVGGECLAFVDCMALRWDIGWPGICVNFS